MAVGFIEAGGLAAIKFGADRVEIDEPALEQRPSHRLQRRVHPPVQLYFGTKVEVDSANRSLIFAIRVG